MKLSVRITRPTAERDKRDKMGIKNKRLKAGWDDRYLSALLFKTG